MSELAVRGANPESGNPVRSALKDPFHREQTPYEILGLTRTADGADVQKAFAYGVSKGKNVQKLTLAKKVLQNPADRAVVDLFHYLPEWANQLTPNPFLRPETLTVPFREATAQAWETQLKTSFPNPLVSHSLAVLWYWWALNEEELRSQGQAVAPVIPIDKMWQRTIACWSMFLSNLDSSSGAGEFSRDIETQITAAVVERLNGRFQDLGRRHNENGSQNVAKNYRGLEMLLAHELRTAKLISSAGIRTGRGKVVCGALMLQQVDILEGVRKQIESALERSPSSEGLKKLLDALSPNSNILALIASNKPQAALEAVDEKEKNEIGRRARSHGEQQGTKGTPAKVYWQRAEREFRETKEGKDLLSLRVRALHSLAVQQASLNQLEDALTSWECALGCQLGEDLKATILAGLVSCCQSSIAALQQHRPEVAIATLERALRLADDPKLRLLLADLLTDRAIRVINEAQRTANPENPNGEPDAEQVKTALKQGVDDFEKAAKLGSKRAAEQLETARTIYEEHEAHQAAERDDWDPAIRSLRKSLVSASGAGAAVLKKNLAVCLGNRAMVTANRAIENPSEGTVRALRSAEQDLAEAMKLDPSDQHIRANWDSIHKLLLQLEGASRFSPEPEGLGQFGTSEPALPTAPVTRKKKNPFNSLLSFIGNLIGVMLGPPGLIGFMLICAAGGLGGIWTKISVVLLVVWSIFVVYFAWNKAVDDYRRS